MPNNKRFCKISLLACLYAKLADAQADSVPVQFQGQWQGLLLSNAALADATNPTSWECLSTSEFQRPITITISSSAIQYSAVPGDSKTIRWPNGDSTTFTLLTEPARQYSWAGITPEGILSLTNEVSNNAPVECIYASILNGQLRLVQINGGSIGVQQQCTPAGYSGVFGGPLFQRPYCGADPKRPWSSVAYNSSRIIRASFVEGSGPGGGDTGTGGSGSGGDGSGSSDLSANSADNFPPSLSLSFFCVLAVSGLLSVVVATFAGF